MPPLPAQHKFYSSQIDYCGDRIEYQNHRRLTAQQLLRPREKRFEVLRKTIAPFEYHTKMSRSPSAPNRGGRLRMAKVCSPKQTLF